MRILITGSQGTLGRVLWAELEKRGHSVYGCDLKHSASPRETRCDIAEWRQVERLFGESCPFDAVYHLAAEFGRQNGEDYYEQLWRHNAIGTRNTIEACTRLNPETRLIFASSSEAYGEASVYSPVEGAPLAESFLDTYAPAFHNEYALSKWTNERQIFIAAQNRGLRACVLRFFNAYGPGEHYSDYRSVVCLFAHRLLTGQNVTVYRNYHRVFMWVGDWARTVANVCERFDALPRSKGKWHGSRPSCVPVYNIGGEEYTSVEEMLAKLQILIPNSKSKIKVLDKEAANVTNKRPDNSLARADLGHDPQVKLADGLPPTVEWLRAVNGMGVIGPDAAKWRDPAFAICHGAEIMNPYLKCNGVYL